MLAVLGLSIGALIGLGVIRWPQTGAAGSDLVCASPTVLDGDTIRCGGDRIRLAGIDSPELPGHCRPGRDCTPGDPYAATDNLKRIIGSSKLTCKQSDIDHYGRIVASCKAGEIDLSCQQLKDGQAVRRYGWIWC